jgi:hypothetical protein
MEISWAGKHGVGAGTRFVGGGRQTNSRAGLLPM